MSFNSYHRRGSRSAAQATLAQQNLDEWEKASFCTVSARDIQVLNKPSELELEPGLEDQMSEDSRNFGTTEMRSEVRSEEFAILSTSSDRDEATAIAEAQQQQLEIDEQRRAVSNSQRIDDWCVQNDRRALSSLRTPANKRVQEIVEAWGVENDTPAIQVVRAFRETQVAARHCDNYTAHILDLMSPLQRLRLRSFAESMRPLLNRRLGAQIPAYRFRNLPSVFVNRDLQFQHALQLENAAAPGLTPSDAELEESATSSQTLGSTYSLQRSSTGIQSWRGWNIVTRFSPDHITSY
ncbi:LAME_0G03708g1_1 [Lachancea meyersii CBS 8951]|uniref:LAME_0G03708g1_1 n=1 Tax=Lachancea meyersii CBS 8951 TaxID=1266667 RepID=A0A1G4K6N9_9SACH|nr:LAME_0G03708g1_1 [Lachancea meyersii CBS 8951]